MGLPIKNNFLLAELVDLGTINDWGTYINLAHNTLGLADTPSGGTSTLVGSQAGYPLASATKRVQYTPWNGAADVDVYGIAPGTEGQIYIHRNVSATKIMRFYHESSSATSATYRMSNRVTTNSAGSGVGAGTPVAPGGMIAHIYSSLSPINGRWVLLFHEQGMPFVPTFSAGDFGGTGGGWTVVGGNLKSDSIYIKDNFLYYSLSTDGNVTTVTSTPSVLNRTLYGYKASQQTDHAGFGYDGTNNVHVNASVKVNGTVIELTQWDGTNWAATAAMGLRMSGRAILL